MSEGVHEGETLVYILKMRCFEIYKVTMILVCGDVQILYATTTQTRDDFHRCILTNCTTPTLKVLQSNMQALSTDAVKYS